MRISAKCAACGSDQFSIPKDTEVDQTVRCASCGADIGQKKAVQEHLRSHAKKEIAKALGKSKLFKKK
ncbi:TPA: ECs_2282 family putative zinc-binding protein [Pseudomonas aeruginosa]|uniref:ECs_2282 family putative zinc-binding protein n=1 Tax=Pseudomonas aeruginosa TaxID=287 RepID=UPI003AF15ACE